MKKEKKILIIDDNPDSRNIISLFLKNENCRIFSASDGLKGMDLFHENKDIELIICDIIMPITDGIEVIQKIKKIKPQIFIIAISGGGILKGNDYLPIAKDFGADAVLYKPFTKEEFFKSLNTLENIENRTGELKI